MKIGYGPLTCQRHPGDTRTDVEIYQEALTLAEEAERLGFDSVWLAEHHFVDDGFVPSLLAMCAAIGARTSRIEIGAGTVNIPFFDPLTFAEEAAVVDLITAGRLLVGLGQGWRPEEIEAFGLTPKELPGKLVDAIDLFRAAWAGETVISPAGGIPVAVRPRPARPGGPPIWIGAEAERAVRRAGRIGDAWQATMVTPESFGESARWALEGAAEAGKDPSTLEIGLHHATFPWVDGDAWEKVRPHHQYFIWKSEHMTDERQGTGAPQPPEPGEIDPDFARELIAAGTPEEVADEILRFQAQVEQPIHYAARLCYPGLDPAVQLEVMRLFAAEVMPRLRAESP